MSLNRKILNNYYIRRLNEALAARHTVEFNIVLTQWLMHRPLKERNDLLDKAFLKMRNISKAMLGEYNMSWMEIDSILSVLGYRLEVKDNAK